MTAHPTFKLREHRANGLHVLTVGGDKASGKTYLLDRIAESCAGWGFRLKVRSHFDESLTLEATRRAPVRVMPLIAGSLFDWGFRRAPQNSQQADSTLLIMRRQPEGGATP